MKLDGQIELRPAADFHVHLRDGEMAELVTPMIRQGGVDTVYVMPNLVPPITTVEHALSYQRRLQALAPDVTFLMTLYMSHELTPETIADAAAAGIVGVKVYPAGVTTNSDSGVVSLDAFYPILAAMQEHDLVLNLHGEVPSTPTTARNYPVAPAVGLDKCAATVLNAEEKFLPTLQKLHRDFPGLRIVLEHVTTRAAIEAVRNCGPRVSGTITAHHLWLTVDEVLADTLNYCKPVAKNPSDRIALLAGVVNTAGRFFFGSDSAPHPLEAKRPTAPGVKAAAGCFTQPYAVQTVVGAMQEAVRRGWIGQDEVSVDVLDDFLSRRGRRFYGLPEKLDGDDGQQQQRQQQQRQRIVLEQRGEKVAYALRAQDDNSRGPTVVPFRAGEDVWSLSWKDT